MHTLYIHRQLCTIFLVTLVGAWGGSQNASLLETGGPRYTYHPEFDVEFIFFLLFWSIILYYVLLYTVQN